MTQQRSIFCFCFVVVTLLGFVSLRADESPLMKLLKSGRVPEERLPTVLEMLCRNASSDELRYVFERVLDPKFPALARQKGMQSLIDAAEVRKEKPSGELAELAQLLSDKDPEIRKGAMQLATLWKVEALAGVFQEILSNPQASAASKQAAFQGLLAVGGEQGKGTIEKLASDAKPLSLRFQAIASLAQFDLKKAAQAAQEALLVASSQDDMALLLDAFLQRQNGPQILAEALGKKAPAADVSKRALRHMFASGHSEKELADVLSSAAGLAADVPPPSQEEVQKIAQKVAEQGDTVRGEAVFRRADVACMRCHAVAHAGGQVGPELSAVGSISPVDYIVNSILNPNLAIKEAYVTRVILTEEGDLITGIVAQRDEDRIVLKDAGGKEHTIPTADIEAEKEGDSLMPRGITKFLTEQEFLDLARFVSELGKPGPYAIRPVPTIQRWRVLNQPAADLVNDIPNAEHIRVHVLDQPDEAWFAAYGTVGGDLPLADLEAIEPESKFAILKGEVDVIEPGPIQFEVKGPDGTLVWLGPENFPELTFTTELAAGHHILTLRVPLKPENPGTLRVTVSRPSGSKAQYEVVGGM